MGSAITASSFIVVAALVVHWAIHRLGRLNAADYYGKRFASAAKQLLADPEMDQEPKEMVLFFAPYIDNIFVARSLCRSFGAAPSNDAQSEQSKFFVDLIDNLDEHRTQFLHMMVMFLFALSYQDGRNGWRLRRKLTTDPKRAVAVYGRSVDRVINKQFISDGAAA